MNIHDADTFFTSFLAGALITQLCLYLWQVKHTRDVLAMRDDAYRKMADKMADMQIERDESRRVIGELNATVGQQMGELKKVYEYNHELENRIAFQEAPNVPTNMTYERWLELVEAIDPDDQTPFGAMLAAMWLREDKE